MYNYYKWTPKMIVTSQYVHAHGTAPRGEGYWAFQFYTAHSNNNLVDVIEFVPRTMTYTAAKRWACRRADELSASNPIVRISVCS